MSGLRRNYGSIEEFEREELRPSFRIGFSIDDLEESAFEGELSFEMEGAEAAFEPADDDSGDDDDAIDEGDDIADERDESDDEVEERPTFHAIAPRPARASARRT